MVNIPPNTPEEFWKECEFDNRYFISNWGNVKRQHINGMFSPLKPFKMKSDAKHYYYSIQTQKKGKRTNHRIHRLVATAFCDGKSEEKNIVDHIDRNTYNNHASNLRWVSQRENVRNSHSYRSDLPSKNHSYFVNKDFQKKVKDSKKYYCEYCDVAFTNNSHLITHTETEKHIKKYLTREDF